MKKRNATRNNGHTSKHFGNGKWVTYCPVCVPTMANDPQSTPGMSVNPEKLPTEARCKNGHTWTPC